MNSPLDRPQIGGDSIDLMAGVVRFLRSVRSRIHLVILCIIASLGLGAFYYTTAERKFESSAKLLIMQIGGESIDKDGRKTQTIQDKMPEFEQLLVGDSTLKEALRNLPPDHRIDFAGVKKDKWLDAFRSKIAVGAVRKTNIMTVSFRSKDPTTAYTVVTQLLDSFTNEVNRIHQDERGIDLKILTQTRDTTERELKQCQRELRQLEAQTQEVFGVGDKAVNTLTEKVTKLNQDWIDANRARVELQALYDQMMSARERGEDLSQFAKSVDPALASRLAERRSGVDPSESYAMGKIHQELITAQSLLQEKSAALGERHPEIIRLKTEIATKQSLLEQRRLLAGDNLDSVAISNYLLTAAQRNLQVAISRAERSREVFEQFSAQAHEKRGQFADIEDKRAEKVQLQEYLASITEQMKTARLGQQNTIRARVTVYPEINSSPVTPRLTMTVFACLVLGGAGAFALVYVLDLVDDRFRSPDDLKRELGAPILAMVRKLPVLADQGLQSLYPFAKPNSVESEAFRTLRTAIDFSGEETRRLTISSTEPGDGKTTVFASLAVAFAQSGKRTLAIDGDMRRPGLTKLFELAGHEGLSTILRGNGSVEEIAEKVIVRTELANLDLISSGPKPVNPVELLSGERLADLIAWADGRYDQILIDAPPSLAVADVQVIGRVVDGAILIVRPDTNRRRMVIRAAESLTALGCELLGIVVNQLQPKTGEEYQYGYGYGYGGNGGYGYGHDEEPPTDSRDEVQTIPMRKAA
jgi:capsular exopolysaccharide synthesis family protein